MLKQRRFTFAAVTLTLLLAGSTRAQTSMPTTVTMQMQSVPPRDAIDELAKQTGVEFAFWPDQMFEQNRQNQNFPKAIDVDVTQKPFWVALGAICEAAHLNAQQINTPSRVTLTMGNDHGVLGKRPQFVGPVSIVVANSIDRNNSMQLDADDPQPSHNCQINLIAYVDPRIRLMRYHFSPQVDAGEDDNGKTIVDTDRLNANAQNVQDANCPWVISNLTVPLDYDPQTSHKLAQLKGSIKTTIAAEVERLEIADLNAPNADKEAGGVHLTIDSVTADDHNMTVHVTIVPTDMPRDQFSQLYRSIFREIHFQNADGKAVNSGGGGGGGGGDKLKYEFHINYPNETDKPTKLYWDITTRTEDVDLPFEFKDLPLP